MKILLTRSQKRVEILSASIHACTVRALYALQRSVQMQLMPQPALDARQSANGMLSQIARPLDLRSLNQSKKRRPLPPHFLQGIGETRRPACPGLPEPPYWTQNPETPFSSAFAWPCLHRIRAGGKTAAALATQMT